MNRQATRTTVTNPFTELVNRPACQRCGHRDRAGLAHIRGIRLCRLCHLIALVRR